MKNNSYEVSINLTIEAKNKQEAIIKFWERVDDTDYPTVPEVKEIK